MQTKFTLLVALISLLLTSVARADMVPGLHAATVPVDGQGDAALASASRDALAQVVVKVSGSSDALRHPVIVEALPEARSHVQQYAFLRDDAPEATLQARFEFDDSYVNRLLREAGLPLWTANRPRVLVWVAAERDGQRQLISTFDTPDLAARLMREFERRGVPAQLPLFDLRDATAISVDDVWAQQAGAITSASERYDVEHILAGRVVEASTGTWAGDWSYISDAGRLDRSASGVDASTFMRQGVDMVAEDMAARYAVAFTGGADDQVLLVVTGVYSFADYATLIEWLERLELIEHANIQSIANDRIEIGLETAVDATQLATIINLNERLQPQPLPGESGALVYQWLN